MSIPSPATPITEVAAGVLLRPDGRFLLGSRPAGKPYAGYWEFPGGKVEAGETLDAALRRELHEELGITVEQAYPWVTQTFHYPHAHVRLHFFQVTAWQGEPHPKEGQQFAWQRPESLTVAPILPANAPILKALSLPRQAGISDAARLGVAPFLAQLEQAMHQGLRLVHLRDKTLDQATRSKLGHAMRQQTRHCDALLLVHDDLALAREVGADGIHLSAALLADCRERPSFPWVGASCHNAAELAQASALGLDYAWLGPVLPTATHPEARLLGWDGLRALLADGISLPVFALGGMHAAHLPQARQAGAHGIAMLRQAWLGHTAAEPGPLG